MTDVTRRPVLAAVGVALSSAGCLTERFGGWHGATDADPEHAVTLRSDAERAYAVRVRIVREATGDTVFETTREVAPDTETEVYDTWRADPDGVESFRVCAELVGEATTTESKSATATIDDGDSTGIDSEERRACTTIETSKCYGNVEVVVTEDDSLNAFHSIC